MSSQTPAPTADPPAAPDPVALDAAALEKLSRYETWSAKLESTLADYVRRVDLYRKGFYTLTAAGFACFLFGVFPGIWGSMSATVVSVVGYMMLKTRIWELKVEIEELRVEIDHIRTGRPLRKPLSPRW